MKQNDVIRATQALKVSATVKDDGTLVCWRPAAYTPAEVEAHRLAMHAKAEADKIEAYARAQLRHQAMERNLLDMRSRQLSASELEPLQYLEAQLAKQPAVASITAITTKQAALALGAVEITDGIPQWPAGAVYRYQILALAAELALQPEEVDPLDAVRLQVAAISAALGVVLVPEFEALQMKAGK